MAESDAAFASALTGDWGGLRTQLLWRGVSLEGVYTGEASANVSGGIERNATYLDDVDLKLTIDADRLVGWRGASFFVYGLGTHGGNPSDFVGDAQGVSDIAAPARWRLNEAWIQQNVLDNKLSVLFGRYDVNAEFYLLRSAELFFNSSFGIGPEFSQTGRGGPSIFPETALGARVELKPSNAFAFRVAALDGVPVDVRRPDGSTGVFRRGDGVLLVAEVDYLIEPEDEGAAGAVPGQPRGRRIRIGRAAAELPSRGKIALGGWYYTASFDDVSRTDARGEPVRHTGSGGMYLVAEQTVYRSLENPARRVTLFGQFGLGDPRVNRFSSYTGAGVTVSHLVGQADDELGLAVAAAHNGSEFIDAARRQGQRLRTSEVALDLTYLWQVRPWLSVQPDVQYVINPGTTPNVRDALVIAVRFQSSF